MIGSRVPAIDTIYVAVIGGLLVAAAISAVKFQEAQNSIERRSQIGLALTDSYVALRRNMATDRERPVSDHSNLKPIGSRRDGPEGERASQIGASGIDALACGAKQPDDGVGQWASIAARRNATNECGLRRLNVRRLPQATAAVVMSSPRLEREHIARKRAESCARLGSHAS